MTDQLTPSLSEVQEALASLKPAASFISRLCSLSMIAEMACHWRPQLDSLYLQPAVVNTIFAIRNAYHRIEEEHCEKALEFKYPRPYHQIVEMTKVIHQLCDQQKLSQASAAQPVPPAVSGLPANVPPPVLPVGEDPITPETVR
ncbi:hypothetical protein CVT24_005628, partial [Panaeolus cyanescens]